MLPSVRELLCVDGSLDLHVKEHECKSNDCEAVFVCKATAIEIWKMPNLGQEELLFRTSKSLGKK